LNNLISAPENDSLKSHLQNVLLNELKERNDTFLPGSEYMKRWNYEWYGNDAPDER
jgi:hypothetical protein